MGSSSWGPSGRGVLVLPEDGSEAARGGLRHVEG